MPGEFEGDLTEAVFWGADMSGARFRDVNFTGARISHAWVVDVDIDAFVDKLVVNGVDVTDYVNEHDEWYPVRAMIRASDPDGLRAAWAALEEVWAPTIARAQALGEEKAQESVDEEFSFVQTVRPRTQARSTSLGPDSTTASSRRSLKRSPCAPTVPRSFALTWPTSTLRTSREKSRCSRTARPLCSIASRPSWKKSSGTTATRSATSRCSNRRRSQTVASRSRAAASAAVHHARSSASIFSRGSSARTPTYRAAPSPARPGSSRREGCAPHGATALITKSCT